MALAINGTTGISGVDGSTSAPAIVGSDSNTGLSFASDTINLNTGGSVRAQLDSNGRLSIGGQNSVSTLLHVENSSGDAFIRCRASVNYGLLMTDSSNGNLRGFVGGGGAVNLGGSNLAISAPLSGANIVFQTSGTGSGDERMRIGANGPEINNSSARVLYLNRNGSAGTLVNISFQGTNVGQISVDTNTVNYQSNSDYRLKENVVTLSNAITRLKTLKPYRFNFIADSTKTLRDGFLAHEVSSIVPEAITGTKDETETRYYMAGDELPEGKEIGDIKEENAIKAQGIDQSKLVPLLTAALQEAVAKIETLETKVAALEAA